MKSEIVIKREDVIKRLTEISNELCGYLTKNEIQVLENEQDILFDVLERMDYESN